MRTPGTISTTAAERIATTIPYRLGHTAPAIRAYDAAIAHTENTAEQTFLRRRRDELAAANRRAEHH